MLDGPLRQPEQWNFYKQPRLFIRTDGAPTGTAYGWTEQFQDTAGVFTDDPNGRTGTVTDTPAYMADGSTTVPDDTICEAVIHYAGWLIAWPISGGFTGTKSVVTSVACSGSSSLRVTTEIWNFENGDYVSTESSSHQDFGCCCSDCPACSIHYNVSFPGISTISGCADEMLTCAACATLTGCINLVSNAGPGDDLDHFIIGDGSTCNWLSSDSSGSAGDTATNKNLACDCNSSSVPLFVQLQFDPGTGHWFLYVGGGGAGVDPVVYELDTWDCASVGTFTLIDPGNYFCTGWPETVDVTPGAC